MHAKSPAEFPRLIFWTVILFGLLAMGLYGSDAALHDPIKRAEAEVSGRGFNFLSWEASAFFEKWVGAALKAERFLDPEAQTRLARDYASQAGRVSQLDRELRDVIAQPDLPDRAEAQAEAKHALDTAKAEMRRLAWFAAPILQNQTETALRGLGFASLGQIIPPVLYHVSELPMNLILSPRAVINSEMQISLQAGLDNLQRGELEIRVEKASGFSALIEPVGGMGAYPTMVMQSSDLNWLAEVVAHEWVHNWLTLRPLGFNYFKDGPLRTMNETAASLSGKEIARAVIRRYYPDLQVWPEPELKSFHSRIVEREPQPPGFDYRAEMRQTRLRTDALLAAGQIDAAEAYMESRRLYFWEHGHHLRKINQAYFAFYGAYNDEPGGGAAGADPVGPAVQALRGRSPSLRVFLQRIAPLTSFASLENLLQ